MKLIISLNIILFTLSFILLLLISLVFLPLILLFSSLILNLEPYPYSPIIEIGIVFLLAYFKTITNTFISFLAHNNKLDFRGLFFYLFCIRFIIPCFIILFHLLFYFYLFYPFLFTYLGFFKIQSRNKSPTIAPNLISTKTQSL